VVSAGVLVESGAEVSDSVLLPGVKIGKGAVVRGAILDKNVVVPDGAQLGVDLALDRARYTVSAGGVVVLGKGVTAG
jgi:glucose-1-phosphate adenylyltransferase